MSSTVLIAACIVGGTGILIAILLGIANKAFAVDTDPREEAILEVLPGNNCGGCGFPGCSGLAHAIAQGKAPCGQCPVGGDEVASQVAAIMGTRVRKTVRKVACVQCIGTCDRTKKEYNYSGLETCKSVAYMQNGGPKSCQYGCMGFGDCVRVCDFDAIHIVNGVAVADWKSCRGCGKCVEACPRHVIDLMPLTIKHQVLCKSHETGKKVKQVCEYGCIGCKACEKVCKFDAIHVIDNLAKIDPTKCTGCKECSAKCPQNIIR